MAVSEEGLPIGIQLSAAHGDERTLLETAFALEHHHPWPRIQGSPR
jgi:amidase